MHEKSERQTGDAANANQTNRVGVVHSSNCINRNLNLECPKDCGEGCENRNITDGKEPVRVKIMYFPGKGHGAVADVDIPAGAFIGEYVGDVIDRDEKCRRIKRINDLGSCEAQYYIMDLDQYRSIDAQYIGSNMRYVNHSCEPNCSVEVIQTVDGEHLALFAIHDIKRGQELSFDYNMYATDGRGLSKICCCGSTKCTGMLSAKRQKSPSKEKDNSKDKGKSKKKASSNKKKSKKALSPKVTIFKKERIPLKKNEGISKDTIKNEKGSNMEKKVKQEKEVEKLGVVDTSVQKKRGRPLKVKTESN